MPNGKDKLKKLHANLVSEGYDLPDFNTFDTDMADSTKRDKMYKSLVGEGYELPDFDTFSSDMGYSQKKNEPAPSVGKQGGLQRFSTYDWAKQPILDAPVKQGGETPPQAPAKPKVQPQAISNWGQQARSKSESNLRSLGIEPSEQFADPQAAQAAVKQAEKLSFDELQKDFDVLMKAPAVAENTKVNIHLPKGIQANPAKTSVQQAHENIGQIKNIQAAKRRDIAVIHGAEVSKQNPQLAPIEVGKSALQIADPALYKAWERGGFQDRLVQRQAEELGIESMAASGRDDGTMELLAQDIDRLDEKYPEIQENIIRHKMAAKAYEKAGITKFTGNIWTVEKMDEIAKELSPEEQAVYQKYIRPEEEKLGMAVTNMPNWGLSKFGSGVVQIAEGSGLGIGNLVGARTDADIENERLAQATQTRFAEVGDSPFVRNRITELRNKKEKTAADLYEIEDLKKTENAIGAAGKFLGGASEVTGQVAAFALMARGLGNVLSTPFARAGLLQTGSRTAAGVEGIAQTAVDFGIKKGAFDTIGMIATGYMASDNDARQTALREFPDDKDVDKRTALAETIKWGNSLSEMVFRDTKILDLFQSNFSKNISKFVKEMSPASIGSAEFKAGVQNAAMEAVDLLRKAGKNINQEAVEELVPILAETAAMSILAPEKLNAADKIEEMWDTYASMAIDGSVVGALGGIQDYRNSKAQLPFVSNIGRAGFEDFTNAVNLEIDKQEQSGELTPEQAAEKKGIIEAITRQNEVVDKTPALAKMQGRQREKYVAMAVAEQLKKKEAIGLMTVDPVAARTLNNEVAESEAARVGILEGTNFVTEDGGVVPVAEAEKVVAAEPATASRRLQGRLKRTAAKPAAPVAGKVAAELPPIEMPSRPAEKIEGAETGEASPVTVELSTEITEPKKTVKPTAKKPLSELTSEEIGEYRKEVKQFEKDFKEETFGAEGAKKFDELGRKAEALSLSDAERKAAAKERQDMIGALPEDKRKAWEEEQEVDVLELRDIESKVRLVEEAEDLDDLSESLKNPMSRFDAKKPSQESLAVFNAARRKAAELKVSPEDLLQATVKKISAKYPDPADAELMVRNALQQVAIGATKTEAVEKKALPAAAPSVEVQPKAAEQDVLFKRVRDLSESELENNPLLSLLPDKMDESNTGNISVTRDRFGNTKKRFIPFSIIEAANKNDKLGGQTAREINQRGGYSDKELDGLLPEWREMLFGQKTAPSAAPAVSKPIPLAPIKKRISKIDGAKDNLSPRTRTFINQLNEYAENLTGWSEVEDAKGIKGVTKGGNASLESLGEGVEFSFFNPSTKTESKYFVQGNPEKLITSVENFLSERESAPAAVSKPIQPDTQLKEEKGVSGGMQDLNKVVEDKFKGLQFPTDYTKRETRVQYIYSMGANRPVGQNDTWYESAPAKFNYRGHSFSAKKMLNKDGSLRGFGITKSDNIDLKKEQIFSISDLQKHIDKRLSKFERDLNSVYIPNFIEYLFGVKNKERERQIKRKSELYDDAESFLSSKIFSPIEHLYIAAQLLKEGLPILDIYVNNNELPTRAIDVAKKEYESIKSLVSTNQPIQPTTKDQKPEAEKEVTGGVQPSTDSVGGGVSEISVSVLADVDFTAKSGNKAVDENGEPITVYHGTGEDFKDLDEARQNSATGHGDFGKGFYFSASKGIAKYYSLKFKNRVVKEFNIDTKNPFEINIKDEVFDETTKKALRSLKYIQDYERDIIRKATDGDVDFGYKKITKELGDKRFSDILKENGYDAVFVNRTLGGETTPKAEIVVFEKSQIKPRDILVGSNTNVDKETYESADTRGKSFAIIKDGKVLTSGSNPLLADKSMPIKGLLELAKKYDGKLYLSDKPIVSTDFKSGDIMGYTFEQINSKQQGKSFDNNVTIKINDGVEKVEVKQYEDYLKGQSVKPKLNTPVSEGAIVDFPAKKGAPIRYFYKDGAWHFLDSRGKEQKETAAQQAKITDYFNKVSGKTLEQLAPDFEQDIADILDEFPDATLDEIMDEVADEAPDLVATPKLRADTEARVKKMMNPDKTPLQKAIESGSESKGKSWVAKVKAELVKIFDKVFGLNKDQAEAAAEIADLTIRRIAELRGISVAEAYANIAYQQAEGGEQGSILYQQEAERAGLSAQGAIVMRGAAATIYAMTNPNVTTPLHEHAHAYFDALIWAGDNGNAQAAADVEVFAAQAGVTVAEIRSNPEAYTKAQELFARGFEKYLYDGVAPTKELQSLFDKFANWLREIYKTLAASLINVPLNDAMRAVYGRMLTPEQVAKDFPKEEKTAESESEEIRGIKHADTEKDRIESGLPPYDKDGKTDDELEAEANELIDKGWNFEKSIDKVLKDGKILSDAEQVALGKYKLYLRDKATQNPTNENINAYERVLKALEFSGTFAGRALRARQLPVNPEPTLADFLVRQKEESGVDELTPEQIEQNKKEFEALQKASQEWEAKYRALEAEAIKKAADENLSEKKRNKPKTPRTKENIKKERDEILERIRERLKKAKEGMPVDIDGNQVNVQESNVVPYMKQLMAIAPEIPALVKNYIEEGVLELSEIAKRLKNELQADIPDVTEEDAIALIAGEYKTANKKTRDEIQKSLYELRAEAKAIQELQKLEEGEVPTAPSKKVERNKKIADLRKKIKEHPNNQLPQYKKQVQSQIDKLQRDLDSGNYAAPPKKLSIVLDKEARELKRKLVDLKTEREIRLLRESYEKMGYGKKVGEKLIKIANIPRTLMASVDFSAPLRQAIIATIGNPILAAKAFGSMFKAAFNKGYMDEWFFDLESDPNYELIKETGLSIADPNSPFLRAREEAFMSGYVEKVEDFIGEKVFGNKNFGLVKGSERAYVMYLNKMRVDLFNKYADALKAKGKTYENSEEDYKAIAKYVNNITGRGNMGKLEEAAKYLNVLFFSPRLIASRLSLLNPAYFYNLPTDVKKIYVKDMAAFIATGLTVVGMMYFAFGGDDEEDIWVETDPRSSDFMKIRQGDKRWDVWGGFQQYFRTIAQLITSKKKSTQTGEIVELSEDAPFGETRGKLLTRFVRNKLAPVPAFMLNYFSGRTSVGEKVTLKDQLISNLTPLLWQQVYDVAQAEGATAAITMGVPSVFGIGTERYGERAIEAPAKIKVGEKEYKVLGKHEEVLTEMVQKESKTIVDKIKATPDYKEATKVQKVEMVAMGKTMARKKAVEEFKSKFYKDYPPESAEEMKERIMKEVNKKISDLQLKQQIQ